VKGNMQRYQPKIKNTKIEAFQQQIADATYILPITDSGKTELCSFTVKLNDWLVKITDKNVVYYQIMNDKEFREAYEAVSEQPAPRKNLEQDMMDYIRRMEEERLKREGVKPFTPGKPWRKREPWNDIYWCCPHGVAKEIFRNF
jgi:glutaredoxin-related protein